MYVCNNCKTAFEDEVAFCPNCGSNVEQRQPARRRRPRREVISIGGWIGRSLIPCIPIVGGIVYLIMLFIWSGDHKKEESFCNWAKAQLIIMAVGVVLAIIMALVFGSAFKELINSL